MDQLCKFDRELIAVDGLCQDEKGNLCPRTDPRLVVIDYFPGLSYPWLAHPKRRRDGPPRKTLLEAIADLSMWGDVPAFLRCYRLAIPEGYGRDDDSGDLETANDSV